MFMFKLKNETGYSNKEIQDFINGCISNENIIFANAATDIIRFDFSGETEYTVSGGPEIIITLFGGDDTGTNVFRGALDAVPTKMRYNIIKEKIENSNPEYKVLEIMRLNNDAPTPTSDLLNFLLPFDSKTLTAPTKVITFYNSADDYEYLAIMQIK